MNQISVNKNNKSAVISQNNELDDLCKEFYLNLYDTYSNIYRFQSKFRVLRAFDEGNIKNFLKVGNSKLDQVKNKTLSNTIYKQQYTNYIKQAKDLKVAQRNSTETPIYVSISITKQGSDPDTVLLLESMMEKAINKFFKSGHFWQNYRLVLDDFFLLGTGILNYHYDVNDKLILKKIDPASFFVPPYTFSDLKGASFVITSVRMSKEEIVSKKIWNIDELDKIPPNTYFNCLQGNIYNGSPYSEGVKNNNTYNIYFYHRKEFEETLGMYVIRVYAVLGNLIKDVTPISLDSINIQNEEQQTPTIKPYLKDYPFLVFSQYPNSENFFGGSICSKILPAQINVVKLQTLLSLTIDRSQNKGILYNSTKFEKFSNQSQMSRTLRDGTDLALAVKGEPKDAIVPIPISNNSEYIENSLETVVKSIQTDTGIGDAYTGENTQGARNNLLFQSLIARQEQMDRLDDKQILLTLHKSIKIMITNFQKKAGVELLALAKDKESATQMEQEGVSTEVNTLLATMGEDYDIDIKLCKDTVKEFQDLQAIFNLAIQSGNTSIVTIEDLLNSAQITDKDKFRQRVKEQDVQISAEKVQYTRSLRQNYGDEVASQAEQMLYSGSSLEQVEGQIQQEIQQQQQQQSPPQGQSSSQPQQAKPKGAWGGNSVVNGTNTNNIMKKNGSKK